MSDKQILQASDDLVVLDGSRPYSRSEIWADGAIHALGVSAGVIGAIALITMAALYGTAATLGAIVIYGIGLIAMLSFSAAYNMHPVGRRREFLRRLDHAAIFLMIAGTYTPLTTLHLTGAWSIGITTAIWTMAVLGIALKILYPRRYERLSLAAYLAMGWLGVIAIEPLLASLPTSTFVLVGVGGVLYTAGTIFHVWESLPFQNAIWHAFVLAAAMCHYAAIFLAAPLKW